ncbi:hypothetical protein [Streptomyces hiroshimensis]|uniref:Uncharacterized protein n=1 Tax=Streptomyces hiroshimensis TaxID=66424 RepID=A0ABQ2YAL2_9ACTN|nr:hypothetical protein [Streptomyces hiroshimensis]GGX75196.1 hypothetical protein GCM10010324_20740 [Streptomyces hiroshimensis]
MWEGNPESDDLAKFWKTGKAMPFLGTDDIDAALTQPGARPYEFRGRTANGWVHVAGEVLDDHVLDEWLKAAWDATARLPPK